MFAAPVGSGWKKGEKRKKGKKNTRVDWICNQYHATMIELTVCTGCRRSRERPMLNRLRDMPANAGRRFVGRSLVAGRQAARVVPDEMLADRAE